jgi:hypothetical protein
MHKFVNENSKKVLFQRKKVVDIIAVTDVHEARNLLLQGGNTRYHIQQQ